jgi:hypothetical protein
MELDDISGETQAGIAVAGLATLLLSPRVRGLVRQGAVAGLAGLLITGDTLAGWARHLTGGMARDDAADVTFLHELAREAHDELTTHREQPTHEAAQTG